VPMAREGFRRYTTAVARFLLEAPSTVDDTPPDG